MATLLHVILIQIQCRLDDGHVNLYWPSCKQNWASNCLVSNAFLCRTHGKTFQHIVIKFFSDTLCTLKNNFGALRF